MEQLHEDAEAGQEVCTDPQGKNAEVRQQEPVQPGLDASRHGIKGFGKKKNTNVRSAGLKPHKLR